MSRLRSAMASAAGDGSAVAPPPRRGADAPEPRPRPDVRRAFVEDRFEDPLDEPFAGDRGDDEADALARAG